MVSWVLFERRDSIRLITNWGRIDMPAHQLLIIDPSVQTLTLLKNSLEAKAYKVATARDIHKAFEQIRKAPPSVIIANTHLPELMPFEIYFQLLEAAGKDVCWQ